MEELNSVLIVSPDCALYTKLSDLNHPCLEHALLKCFKEHLILIDDNVNPCPVYKIYTSQDNVAKPHFLSLYLLKS